MKPNLAVFALLTILSSQAPAPEPARLPGEPHHHLKIDNEYVRAYYVEVPPHDETQLHQHDHDYIYVSLGPADVVNAVLNKPEAHLVLKDGETHFTRGGFAHVARNLSDAPFRNVTIELLHPQGSVHNRCAPIVSNESFAICEPSTATDYAITQFETAEITLDLVILRPKAKHTETHTKHAFLVLGDPQINIAVKGKPAITLRAEEMAWFDAGSHVQFSNDGGKTAAFLQIIFKDAGARAKP